MTVAFLELSGLDAGVVVGDVAFARPVEQRVALLHHHDQRVERVYRLARVGDDGALLALHFGEEVPVEFGVCRQLHLFRVDEDELQLGRVFLVEQRGDDGVQTDRFALSGGARHEQVGHFGKVADVYLVVYRLAQNDGKPVLAVLELDGLYDRKHRHDFARAVWYLDAYRTASLAERDDTDTLHLECEGDVLLQIADARYLYSLCGLYLVKRHRRPYRSLYLVGYPDAEILQLLADDVLVFAYLVFRDTDAHAVVFQDNP